MRERAKEGGKIRAYILYIVQAVEEKLEVEIYNLAERNFREDHTAAATRTTATTTTTDDDEDDDDETAITRR